MLLIVTEDGGLLMHHRDDKPEISEPGISLGWFRRSGLEDGETVEDAVRREVREETGLQIADPGAGPRRLRRGRRPVGLPRYVVGGVRPEDIYSSGRAPGSGCTESRTCRGLRSRRSSAARSTRTCCRLSPDWRPS